MKMRTLLVSAPLALLAACGGSTSTGTGSTALDAATPSYSSLSMDQTSSDTAPPAVLASGLSAQDGMMGPGSTCSPRLFGREREVVERVNRHVYKVLGKIERLVASAALVDTGASKTWSATENGVTASFTISVVGPSSYSWELDAGPAGTTPLPVVMTGVIDRSTATGAHQGVGSFEVDFAKLDAAFPAEHVAGGTMQVWFAVSATSRKITVLADQVTWDLDARHFDGMIPSGLAQPRSGAYVYFREPGKGGSLKIQDEMSACGMDPRITDAAVLPSNAQMISRWYKAADGTVRGRTDGLLTGGPLSGANVASVVGVTCLTASAEQQMPVEGFWLVKAEDASGATVAGTSSVALGDASATACDPQLGDVPLLTGNSLDFKGWPTPDPAYPINPFYSDDTPYPFPGM